MGLCGHHGARGKQTAPLPLQLLRAHPRNGSGAERLAQGTKSLFQNEVFFSQKSIRAPGCLPVVFPQRFQCSFAGVNVRSPQDAPLLLQRHLLGTFWKDLFGRMAVLPLLQLTAS